MIVNKLVVMAFLSLASLFLKLQSICDAIHRIYDCLRCLVHPGRVGLFWKEVSRERRRRVASPAQYLLRASVLCEGIENGGNREDK